MKAKFETYVSHHDQNNVHFVVLTHAQGAGKFVVRRVRSDDNKAARYSVSSSPFASQKFQEFLDSIPASLDFVFNQGAVSIAYFQGEIAAEFPAEMENKFEADQLNDISEKSLQGMQSLAEKYAVYEDYQEIEEARPNHTPWLLGVLVALFISALTLLYGSRILPLDWIKLTLICFLLQIPVLFILKSVAASFLRVGKVFLLCFLGVNSVFLVLFIGFISLNLPVSEPYVREGIVEQLFQGGRIDHLMRVRLAEDKNKIYLLPKSILKSDPQYLPRAALFTMRDGLFKTRYVDSVSLAY